MLYSWRAWYSCTVKVSPRWRSSGFTRIELVFTLCAIALVGAVGFVTARAITKQRKIQGCIANLKHINLAFSLWLADNEVEKPPWRIPVAEKGTQGLGPAAASAATWFQFAALSNQLGSPKFLADPADKDVRVATTWDTTPHSGLAAPPFRDNATSYAIALDQIWSRTGPWLFSDPTILGEAILFSDCHLKGSNEIQLCSLGQFNALAFREPYVVWWSPEVHHGEAGRLALLDGSVRTLSAKEIERRLPAVAEWLPTGSAAHFLFPRRSPAATPKNH